MSHWWRLRTQQHAMPSTRPHTATSTTAVRLGTQHSKYVIIKSLLDPQGKMRVVFASVAIGMGIDLQGVDTIIHYGAPSSIEDYFQASGRGGRRGGRRGDSAQSIVYWTPVDCPMRKEPSTPHHKEVNDIRRYLENTSLCRRKWLLDYFQARG